MSRFLVPRTNWRDEYMQALDKAAQRTPVDNGLLSACKPSFSTPAKPTAAVSLLPYNTLISYFSQGAQLSDRIAVLEAENSLLRQQRAAPSSRAAAQAPAPAPDLELQRDLAEALRQKSNFETRLRAADSELETLRAQTKNDARELKDIKTEWAQFSTKTKDLEHELREKKRLLDVCTSFFHFETPSTGYSSSLSISSAKKWPHS